MGTLKYGSPERMYSFDDRTLAHLAVAIVDELRGGAAFSFSFAGDEGPTTVLLSRNVPVRFEFDNSRQISINGDWVEALETAAHHVDGLRIVTEPLRLTQAAEAVRELADASTA